MISPFIMLCNDLIVPCLFSSLFICLSVRVAPNGVDCLAKWTHHSINFAGIDLLMLI